MRNRRKRVYTVVVPAVRYTFDVDLFNELRGFVPEASVSLSARRITLAFKGAKSLHAFLDLLAEDDDVIAKAAAWNFGVVKDWDPAVPALRLRPEIHMDPADMPAVVSCLRRLPGPAAAASLRPAVGRSDQEG